MDTDNIREEYLQIVATVREYVAEQLQLGLFEEEVQESDQESPYAHLL